MQVLRTVAELREWNRAHGGNRPRVLVPTMGALHDGHLSLCDLARKKAGITGTVVATIFVNPTQFGPDEDLAAYPRDLESDLEKCGTHKVDAVFAPADVTEVYAPDASISVSENHLSTFLCGESRPVHFGGVCTVVAKLFNLTQPDAAVFGEKDFQQLAIIRRLVRDLNFPIEIIGGPIVRESDGLAMSSRNAYLSKEQRAQAPIIRQALKKAAADFASQQSLVAESTGSSRKAVPTQQGSIADSTGLSHENGSSFEFLALPVKAAIREMIEAAPLAKVDYIEVVDAETMQPVEEFVPGRRFRIAVAVVFGKTRLIDNIGIDTGR